MASERATRLTAIRTSIERAVEARTAEWLAAGSPPDVSIDGESWNWTAWLAAQTKAIADYTEIIRSAQPYCIRSRVRG